MGQLVVDEDRFTGMLAEVRPHLNELQWRLLLGAQARSLGRGGIKRVAQLTGVHPDTVGRGTRGDPESPLRWTTKSTEKLAGELASAGHPEGYSGSCVKVQGDYC